MPYVLYFVIYLTMIILWILWHKG